MASTQNLRSPQAEHKDHLDAGLRSPLEVVLTVYFSGSNHVIDSGNSFATLPLAELLFRYNQHDDKTQIARGFDGCAIVAGNFLGGLFGAGLKGQARQVMRQVRDLNKQGKKVILNCYGHSRGAIAALLLTKMLAKFDDSMVEINLALLDPVPGNLLITTKIDFLDLTLTNQVMDLSDCRCLRRVLCLYPYKPLPWYYGHAPLIPTYPAGCAVEEDVILGCHSGAQFQFHRGDSILFTPISFISFSRVINFLKTCGSKYEFSNIEKFIIQADRDIGFQRQQEITAITEDQTEVVRSIYQNAQNKFSHIQSRECHSDRQLEIVAIGNESSFFLNEHDRQVYPGGLLIHCDTMLDIKPKIGIIPSIRKNPYLYNTIKWLCVGLAITLGLYLKVPLNELPFSDLGPWWGMFATVPVASIASNIILNWIIKPIINLSGRLFSCCFTDVGHSKLAVESNSKLSDSLIMESTCGERRLSASDKLEVAAVSVASLADATREIVPPVRLSSLQIGLNSAPLQVVEARELERSRLGQRAAH